VPSLFGGFYQPGHRQKKGEIRPDAMRIGDTEIPSYLIHNPLIGAAQLGATARKVADSRLRLGDKERQGLGAGVLSGVLGLAEATPFIRETVELSKLWTEKDKALWFAELAKSRIEPSLLDSIARHLDTQDDGLYGFLEGKQIKRSPKTAKQVFESGIPGLREDVPKAKNQN
jgi:hypothetical protein